jgi:hypothetical protein
MQGGGIIAWMTLAVIPISEGGMVKLRAKIGG